MLAIHAVSQLRLTVTRQVAAVIEAFGEAREVDDAVAALATDLAVDAATIRCCMEQLRDRGLLCEEEAAGERDAVARELSPAHGRDPAVPARPLSPRAAGRVRSGLGGGGAGARCPPQPMQRRLDVLLLGDCDVQMEADFLRQEAASRGIELRVAASFASDTALGGERRHDAVILGALQARHAIARGRRGTRRGSVSRLSRASPRAGKVAGGDQRADPDGWAGGTDAATAGLCRSRFHVHRNRFRSTNLALAEFSETLPDLYLVDVAAAFSASGSAALLDDGLVSFTHFGSPGWMLQRPDRELEAVHGQFPDMHRWRNSSVAIPTGASGHGPRAHGCAGIVLGLRRKKCVVVDLDGVLWPGVLAETGRPFAWETEIGGPNSFVGLYFGIHEALRRCAGAVSCSPASARTTRRRCGRCGAMPRPIRATSCCGRRILSACGSTGGQGGEYCDDRRGTWVSAGGFRLRR